MVAHSKKAPSILGPKLDSKRGPKNELKKGTPLHAPLERLLALSVGVSLTHYLLRFSQSKKGSFLRQFWGPYLVQQKQVLKKTLQKKGPDFEDVFGRFSGPF